MSISTTNPSISPSFKNPSQECFSTDVGWIYAIGLPVEEAVEVLTLAAAEICPLPVPYPAVLGVIGWRGQLVWTIALDLWLTLPQLTMSTGMEARSETNMRPTLVLQDREHKHTLACLVHKLNGIETIDLNTLEDLPDNLPSITRPLFQGKAPHSNTLILKHYQLFQPHTWNL